MDEAALAKVNAQWMAFLDAVEAAVSEHLGEGAKIVLAARFGPLGSGEGWPEFSWSSNMDPCGLHLAVTGEGGVSDQISAYHDAYHQYAEQQRKANVAAFTPEDVEAAEAALRASGKIESGEIIAPVEVDDETRSAILESFADEVGPDFEIVGMQLFSTADASALDDDEALAEFVGDGKPKDPLDGRGAE